MADSQVLKYKLNKSEGLVAGEELIETSGNALSDLEVEKLSAGPALKEIWGKWPGDESIHELLSALTK